MRTLKVLLAFSLTVIPFIHSSASVHDVTEYGVRPGSGKVQTRLVQDAIDKCSSEGGGIVNIPSGTIVCGTVFLRDGVTLNLEKGAVLQGSPDLSDYPDLEISRKGLVHAEHVSNVGITGEGRIDANGSNPVFHSGPKSIFRIYAVNFEHCTGIRVSDVEIVNASFWTLRLDDCDFASIRGVRIHSVSYFNNDGIDIDGRNITVSDCIIDCIDDGICLKSYYRDKPCENISISNCIVSSNCNAIKFGTASRGGFRNIVVSNCIIKAPSQNDYFDYKKYIVPGVTDNYTNNSGIALELVDGGVLEQVVISGITMYNTLTPFFIRLGKRRTDVPGTLSNVSISNITASSNSLMTSSITGIPERDVEGIRFSHIVLNCPGGGRKSHIDRTIPEAENTYPENKIFGADLPAYGFYVRHARNISFEDIHFNLMSLDERPPFVLDDCTGIEMERISTDTQCNGSRHPEWRNIPEFTGEKTARRTGSSDGQIFLSLAKWGFRTMTPLLCDMAKGEGIGALDLVDPLKWDTVIGKGMEIALADGADLGLERGFCDRRWHKSLQERYSYYIPQMAERGISQIVCYSGISPCDSPEDALDVCEEGLGPIVELAEEYGVTLVMELVSSRSSSEIFAKHRFEGYVCDNPEWGAALCRRIGSGRFRLLYDVWHMNDMGRDVFKDIESYHEYISHYHISGIPGRSIPTGTDGFDYGGFFRLLERVGYTGYVGIEPDRIERNLAESVKAAADLYR
ncbi:MAG: TIM barrel protein [Candidatus Cryptobacteroides sp.]